MRNKILDEATISDVSVWGKTVCNRIKVHLHSITRVFKFQIWMLDNYSATHLHWKFSFDSTFRVRFFFAWQMLAESEVHLKCVRYAFLDKLIYHWKLLFSLQIWAKTRQKIVCHPFFLKSCCYYAMKVIYTSILVFNSWPQN